VAAGYLSAGHVELSMDHTDTALQLFYMAHAINSSDISAIYNIGVALQLIDRYEEAISYYNMALNLDPNHLNSLYNRGHAYQDLSRLDVAMDSYKQVLQLDPQQIKAHLNLCNILFATIFSPTAVGRSLSSASFFEDTESERMIDDPIEQCYLDVLSINLFYVRGLINLASYHHSRSYESVLSPSSLFDYLHLHISKKLSACVNCQVYLYQLLKPSSDNVPAAPNLSEDHIRIIIDFIVNLPDGMLSDHHIASIYYHIALYLEPENSLAAHGIRSLSSSSSVDGQASNHQEVDSNYIQQLFDSYAFNFDQALVNSLNYTSHMQVADVVLDYLSHHDSSIILDLGAGTGLFCEALRDKYLKVGISRSFPWNITAVDISSKMLQKARRRDCYSEIVVVDIVEYLDRLLSMDNTGLYHVITAADVFVYFGSLEKVLQSIFNLLTDDGILVFTVEEMLIDDNRMSEDYAVGYALMTTGRYVHSKGYLLRLSSKIGYESIDCQQTILRYNQGKPVHGLILSLGKTPVDKVVTASIPEAGIPEVIPVAVFAANADDHTSRSVLVACLRTLKAFLATPFKLIYMLWRILFPSK
jgi:predicted TPR repeat methyltransferase